MKLFIPNCKTEFILTESWTFRLFHEKRNISFGKKIGVFPSNISTWGDGGLSSTEVTLPVGTVLKVNRVYIRQQAGDYDSVTFGTRKLLLSNKKITSGRFWVKLRDVNQMHCEVFLGEGMESIPSPERISRIDLIFEE